MSKIILDSSIIHRIQGITITIYRTYKYMYYKEHMKDERNPSPSKNTKSKEPQIGSDEPTKARHHQIKREEKELID